MHKIPIYFEDGHLSPDESLKLTGLELPEGGGFREPPKPDGANMFLESLLLAVMTKEVLAAGVTAAATIWAARIAAKSAARPAVDAAATQARPTIQIIMLEEDREIAIDGRLAQTLEEQLPNNVKEITGIRFGQAK